MDTYAGPAPSFVVDAFAEALGSHEEAVRLLSDQRVETAIMDMSSELILDARREGAEAAVREHAGAIAKAQEDSFVEALATAQVTGYKLGMVTALRQAADDWAQSSAGRAHRMTGGGAGVDEWLRSRAAVVESVQLPADA